MAATQLATNRKQDVIEGLEFLMQQADRIATRFTDDDWTRPSDHGGWTAKQVYAHVTGLGALIPQFVEGYVAAGPANDIGPKTPIDDINAGLVGDRTKASPRELGDEFAKNYGAALDWARKQPDDFFAKRGTLGGYENWTAADLLVTAFVMHAVAHLYNASTRFP
ncbi:MAG: maleylpyruvate isomerase N-terminal domain-containing protein [Dehalococcoidia bacterium]